PLRRSPGRDRGRRFVGGRRGRHGGGNPVRGVPAQRGGHGALEARAGRAPGRPGGSSRLASSPRERGSLRDTMDLFEQPASTAGTTPAGPLADRMRPSTLDEVVGQEHLLGPGRVLRAAIESGELHSMILWGPPGSGKTTLASLMAHVAGARFVAFSAVLSGVKEIRQVVAEAETERTRRRQRTIVFVDEIHRFNRGQQDAFLPHVEKGFFFNDTATTENPSFEVNAALLSRCRVYVLRALEDDDLRAIMRRALADGSRGLAALRPEVTDDGLNAVAHVANGDARVALNVLEVAVSLTPSAGGVRRVTDTTIREAAQRRTLLYDKSGEEHYNLISA